MEKRYVSPDGALTFLVIRKDGEVSLGFDGVPSHTHGDIEAELSGLPEEEAVAQYVARLVSNKSLIAIATVDGKIRDIWVSTIPPEPDEYKPANEIVTYRFWDSTLYKAPWEDGR